MRDITARHGVERILAAPDYHRFSLSSLLTDDPTHYQTCLAELMRLTGDPHAA